jgi:hypothetical protein
MNNQNTVDELRHHADQALNKLKNRTHIHFKIADLDFDGGVFLNGIEIKDKPLTGVMGALKAKKEFTAFSQKMSPDDWDTVSSKLKATEGETKMIARIMYDDDGRETISAIFPEIEKKKSDADANVENYFNWISESLTASETNFKLQSFNFDEKKVGFTVNLLSDKEFNVFDNGSDHWKQGTQFSFNSLSFNASPFFERLVCSNGAVSKQHGFNTYVSQARFNTERIRKTIEKNIQENDRSIEKILFDAVNHLKGNNISLAEFFKYRAFFSSKNENGKYDSLLEKYFSDRHFYKAYGENIAARSHKWKSTANTGINAYDFFNQLTNIATHNKLLNHTDKINLQIDATNLLFKKELDLEDIASPTTIIYPKTDIMY